MNGVQLCGSTAPTPTATNEASTATLIVTRIALTRADLDTPTTSTTVASASAATATRFTPPPATNVVCPSTTCACISDVEIDGGSTMPKSCSRLEK
jgi:hypothetical protein